MAPSSNLHERETVAFEARGDVLRQAFAGKGDFDVLETTFTAAS